MKLICFDHVKFYLFTLIHVSISNCVDSLDNMNSSSNYNCKEKWPSLEFFVPFNLQHSTRFMEKKSDAEARGKEYINIFIRSFLLFFPLQQSNVSLRLVIDSEVLEEKESYKLLKKVVNTTRLMTPGGVHISRSSPSPFYRFGYDRQQLLMFWADNFTTSEYVAFSDTDTLFITYVDKEDLFENGKPVVISQFGNHNHFDWAAGTKRALKVDEILRCMTYFPVIIKTSHLKEMREHIENVHGNNKTFNQIFYDDITTVQICRDDYKWYHRDDYKWYVQSVKGTTTQAIATLVNSSNYNFTSDMFELKPRIASHARYRYGDIGSIKKCTELLNLVLQRGVCISPPFPRKEDVCNISGIIIMFY